MTKITVSLEISVSQKDFAYKFITLLSSGVQIRILHPKILYLDMLN